MIWLLYALLAVNFLFGDQRKQMMIARQGHQNPEFQVNDRLRGNLSDVSDFPQDKLIYFYVYSFFIFSPSHSSSESRSLSCLLTFGYSDLECEHFKQIMVTRLLHHWQLKLNNT